MKLKKALKIAMKKQFKYIAVDYDKSITAFHEKPVADVDKKGDWRVIHGEIEKIGMYSGSKKWRKTLRKVA